MLFRSFFTAAGSRPDLVPVVGSANHGYDIQLDPAIFHWGVNRVRVFAIDPLTGRQSLLGTRIVNR